MAGGLASAALLVILGSLARPFLPGWVSLLALAALGVVVAGNELGLLRIPLPQNARQVPSSVIFEGGRVGALWFGFEMGTGMRTFLPSTLPHLVALTVALYAAWPYALAAGAGFGVGRAVMPLIRQASGDTQGWDGTFVRRQRLVRTLGLFVCVAGVATVVAAAA